MTIVTRKAVRVLLLNQKNELLLMCVEDFDISKPDGTKNRRFWCTVGGGIEPNETIEQAAIREIFEETGIQEKDINLGPIVWHSEIDLMLKGKLTRFDELFIVAKTTISDVTLYKPTAEEQAVVKKLQWFALKDIQQSSETVFPVNLDKLLPDILKSNYPNKLIEIHLQ